MKSWLAQDSAGRRVTHVTVLISCCFELLYKTALGRYYGLSRVRVRLTP